MILNKNIITFCFTVLLSFISNSQENKVAVQDSILPENLDEVIITATRTIRQLSSLPLPAQIITSTEIKAINSVRLNDILSEQTGLITVSDFGGGEGVQMQGLDSQYTLILIDGVPLIGRSAGTLDLSRVTVGDIKQIEIVKGASSSLYGSEALAGVINIITENPKQGFHGNIGYRYATFNTNDISAIIGYKKDKFSISGFANRYSSDGYDLDANSVLNTVDPYKNYTFNIKTLYDFSDKTNLLISGRYYTQNQDYIATEVLKGESDLNEWNTRLKLSHTYNDKWQSYFEFYATQYKAEEYLNNPDNSRYSDSDFNQLLIRPELRAIFNLNKKSSFIGGIGMNHETLKRADFITDPEFNSFYTYLQYDTNPTEKINVIIGARYDLHSEYESQFSPKVALRYEFNDKISVKGSVGYGFKAPDFRQLYFDFSNSQVGYTVLGYNAVTTKIPQMEDEGQIARIIVPLSEFEDELKPENSVSFNLGADYNPLSNLKFSVNIFRNNIQDLIDTRVIAEKTNGQNVFSYYNVSKVFTQGLEFNTSWSLNNELKISGGYQLLFAKDKDAIDAFKNGEAYARLPGSPSFQLDEKDYFGLYNRSRHMANIKVFYTISKWGLNTNIRAIYRSKYGLYDTNSNTYLDKYDEFIDGHTLWNFAINKTFFKDYQISFGIDNIFDYKDSQNISTLSGRIIYGKLNIQF